MTGNLGATTEQSWAAKPAGDASGLPVRPLSTWPSLKQRRMPQGSTENASLSVSDARSAHRYSCVPALTSDPTAKSAVRPPAPGQGRPESRLDGGLRSGPRVLQSQGSVPPREHGLPADPRGLHAGGGRIQTALVGAGGWTEEGRQAAQGRARAEVLRDGGPYVSSSRRSPARRLRPPQPPHFGQDDPLSFTQCRVNSFSTCLKNHISSRGTSLTLYAAQRNAFVCLFSSRDFALSQLSLCVSVYS